MPGRHGRDTDRRAASCRCAGATASEAGCCTTTEAQAKAHCPADLVIWANLDSKIYHFSGHKSYGTTKKGTYMCEKDAGGQGFRASKTEKHGTMSLPPL